MRKGQSVLEDIHVMDDGVAGVTGDGGQLLELLCHETSQAFHGLGR